MELPGLGSIDPGTFFMDPDLDPSTPLRVVYEVPVEGWSQWAGEGSWFGPGRTAQGQRAERGERRPRRRTDDGREPSGFGDSGLCRHERFYAEGFGSGAGGNWSSNTLEPLLRW